MLQQVASLAVTSLLAKQPIIIMSGRFLDKDARA